MAWFAAPPAKLPFCWSTVSAMRPNFGYNIGLRIAMVSPVDRSGPGWGCRSEKVYQLMKALAMAVAGAIIRI